MKIKFHVITQYINKINQFLTKQREVALKRHTMLRTSTSVGFLPAMSKSAYGRVQVTTLIDSQIVEIRKVHTGNKIEVHMNQG